MSETRLFRLPGRGAIRVTGSERVRWLDGMLTNDVKALEAAGPGAGCYALLLTHQGRVVADLHVLLDEDAIELDLERSAVPLVLERLDKLIIADDVQLEDASDRWERLTLEGDSAAGAFSAASAPLPADADTWSEMTIAGSVCRVAAYGFTGAPAFQIFAPAGAGEAVAEALVAQPEVDVGDDALLERLRIEAGTPWLGRELDESVLPAEAGLERAVSETKGCYTGQEVVARLRSRNRRNHVLVGLQFPAAEPEPGAEIQSDEGRRIGEVTSTTTSPRFGAIGLAFVRHEHAEAGTSVTVAGTPARVASLPFAAEA